MARLKIELPRSSKSMGYVIMDGNDLVNKNVHDNSLVA